VGVSRGNAGAKYIQGIPGTENEISVGTEVSSATAWTRTFTNTQLSAVRLRLKWPSLFKQEDDGDLVGNSVNYAIDLQTDGTWQTVLNTSVTGKTTSGYERSHRIDLPQAGSTWTIRLRKITADANSAKIGDTMTLQSFTEVIDAKLRYPNTALLYIEFDSASSMALSRRFPASRVAASSVFLMFMILKPGLTAAHGPGRLSGRGRITRHGFFTIWLYLTASALGTA
jgi:predicted phage tail protein